MKKINYPVKSIYLKKLEFSQFFKNLFYFQMPEWYLHIDKSTNLYIGGVAGGDK
jgi:hypothetical protein